MTFKHLLRTLSPVMALSAAFAASGCQSLPEKGPLPIANSVDLDRFMGDWYVIANIPTFIEKKAYNAIESYQRRDDGAIATTFRFRKGGFDGKLKTYNPTGFVTDDPSNAVWRMQFIWPFKGDYRIVHVDENYQYTIIGRNKRDYVWIMARTPQVSNEVYFDLVRRVRDAGYETAKLGKVPQRWPEQS